MSNKNVIGWYEINEKVDLHEVTETTNLKEFYINYINVSASHDSNCYRVKFYDINGEVIKTITLDKNELYFYVENKRQVEKPTHIK